MLMVLTTLVVAHDLVFLVGYGSAYQVELARTGHDARWETTVAIVAATAVVMLAVSLWQLHRLGVVARQLRVDEGGLSPHARAFARDILGLWGRLALASTVLFAIQENVEHASAHEALPGLSVLGSPEYPFAALIIAAVSLAVATIGALLGWRRERLAAQIAAALRRRYGAPQPAHRIAVMICDRRPESHVGRGLAVRAPPVLSV